MLRACLLAAAVCMDTLFAAMGCSMSGIAVPKRCAAVISVVGSVFLGISLLGGQVLASLLPEAVCKYGGAAVLCGIGGVQLMKEVLQALFRARKPHIRRKALGLVIDICFDETLADADGSKTLSIGEAVTFAAALSLDSLASGLGAGVEPLWILPCMGMTLVLGFALTMLGAEIGKHCGKRHLQWIGGVMLLVLAGCRLL
jgi:putative sporulation protein YtaF